jgi:hypothetical protein
VLPDLGELRGVTTLNGCAREGATPTLSGKSSKLTDQARRLDADVRLSFDGSAFFGGGLAHHLELIELHRL